MTTMKLARFLSAKAFVVLVIVFLCFSCQAPKKQQIPRGEIHLELDPFDLPAISKLSELAVSVRLLPLETSSKCIMGSIKRLFVGKEHILISTRGGSKDELLLFSSEGNFIRKIGSVGKGPGEYSDIRQFSAFEDSLVVYVSPMSSRKVTKYGFDGSFIEEIPNPSGLGEPMVLDYNRVAYSGYQNYEVQILNSTEPDTQKYIDIPGRTRSRMPFFSGNQNTGFFYTALGRDTIWRIDQDSMRPAIIYDFGSGHISSSDYFKSMSPRGYPLNKLSIGTGVFYNSGYYQFLLLREVEEGENPFCHIVLNSKTGESWHLAGSPTSDNILFSSSTDFRSANPNGEWVSVVGAYELIEALPKIKANKDFDYPENLIEQIENLSLEDNPVLVFYTFK